MASSVHTGCFAGSGGYQSIEVFPTSDQEYNQPQIMRKTLHNQSIHA